MMDRRLVLTDPNERKEQLKKVRAILQEQLVYELLKERTRLLCNSIRRENGAPPKEKCTNCIWDLREDQQHLVLVRRGSEVRCGSIRSQTFQLR